MRVSQNKVNPFLEDQLFATLHQTLADLKTPKEVEKFLKTFLNETEHSTLAKRLAIAYWLDKGRGYTNISQNIKVSSATIAAIQEKMGQEGTKLALQKIKAEEWASKWSERIRKIVR